MTRSQPVLLAALAMALVEASYARDPSEIARYTHLQLADVVVNADVIVLSTSAIERVEGTNVLHRVRIESCLAATEAIPPDATNTVFVITPRHDQRDDFPVLVSNERHVLFLKRIVVEPQLFKKLGLPHTAVVCRLLDGWQSSLCVDYSVESLAVRLLKERYKINTPEEAVEAIRALSSWRKAGARDQQLDALFGLWLTKREDAICAENIPKIVERLGGRIVEKDGQWLLEKGTGSTQSRPKSSGE